MLALANTVYFVVSIQMIASGFSQAVMTNNLFSPIGCCLINNFPLAQCINQILLSKVLAPSEIISVNPVLVFSFKYKNFKSHFLHECY